MVSSKKFFYFFQKNIMKQVLKNPFVVGAISGAIACGAHYANRKIVKKEEKVEPTDLVKVFIAIAVLVGGGMFVASKKNLLPKKLLSSSSKAANPVATSVPTAAAPTPTMTQTGGAPVAPSVPLARMSAPQTMNTSGLSGNQTISSMPSPQTGSLQLSDINDVIHTGTPNF